MGLLTPLYIAGALAIGLPILFHLIRRTPHGWQPFGSLMFLAASPPRLTRRSRLTHLLLLLLRAAALALLAFAFARPFFHQNADEETYKTGGRRIALLVDTSASMQREDLWRQATAQVEQTLRELSPADEAGLFLFDRQVRPAMGFDEWREADPASRAAMMRTRLAGAKPSWQPTRLGEALAAVADQLGESREAAGGRTARQIVLISDLQQGAHVESLQGHQWPANVTLQVRSVTPRQAGNASLQWVHQEEEAADGRLRVRVSNQPDSASEQFSLAWANDRGTIAGVPPVNVYVAPGRSQIVRVARPEGGAQADRLVLGGDACAFDNTLYVAPPRMESLRVLYIGEDALDDVNGLQFYLRRALADTPQRKVELLARRDRDTIGDPELLETRLVVVGGLPGEAARERLRRYVEAGGEVLWVMQDVRSAGAAGALMGTGTMEAQEALGDFALVSRVDVQHPLFAAFADPRFGDFTKIHFWKHRRLVLPEQGGAATLAWFDRGDPFVIEKAVGRGHVRVMTSGWQPADSQLALSTKFVPFVEGLIRRADAAAVEAQYTVGEAMGLPPAGGSTRTLVKPDGRRIDLAAAGTFDGADRPGIYHLLADGRDTPLAVNLPSDESRTTPLAAEALEQWGAKLGRPGGSAEQGTEERRLRIAELENRQKLWRWLILGVLGLLAAETALAGRLTRRALKEQAAV